MVKRIAEENWSLDGELDEECWIDGDEQVATVTRRWHRLRPNVEFLDGLEDCVLPQPNRGPLAQKYEIAEAIGSALCAQYESRLGSAAMRSLRDRVRSAVYWVVEKHDDVVGPLEPFARTRSYREVSKFFEEFGADALRIERTDQDERARATELLELQSEPTNARSAIRNVRPARGDCTPVPTWPPKLLMSGSDVSGAVSD